MGKQGKQKHRTSYGQSKFKLLVAAMGLLQIKFSSRHNAMWGLADAAHLVVAMCEHSKCANETVQNRLYLKMEGAKVAVPTSAWLLGKLKSMKPYTMRKRCDAMLHCTAVEAVSTQLRALRRSRRAAVVAIDETKMPRYDKNPDMKHLVKSKHDRGTVNLGVHDVQADIQGRPRRAYGL